MKGKVFYEKREVPLPHPFQSWYQSGSASDGCNSWTHMCRQTRNYWCLFCIHAKSAPSLLFGSGYCLDLNITDFALDWKKDKLFIEVLLKVINWLLIMNQHEPGNNLLVSSFSTLKQPCYFVDTEGKSVKAFFEIFGEDCVLFFYSGL